MLLRPSLQDKEIPRRDRVREGIIEQWHKWFDSLKRELTVTRGLRVLREQLFLRLLLTNRRASEYTLDFRELPRYVEAKLT
jgi:hypothetical protein